MPSEEDDPIIASYNVYIAPPTPTSTSPSSHPPARPKIYLLQYPSHRSSSKPYTSSRSQKPLQLRIKPKTGLFELDIPLYTRENYNHQKGAHFGQNLANASVTTKGVSYGLANGFAGHGAGIPAGGMRVQDVRQFDEEEEQVLRTQTLGGKAPTLTDRDPIYLLATLHNDQVHFSQIDAVVQMRPQLHHLDAEDDLNRKKEASAKNALKPGFEGGPAKLETKAIELKLKDNKEDVKDKNLNANAKLLRDIQADEWVGHEWVERREGDGNTLLESMVDGRGPQLKGMLDNDEWLDKMSSPGIDLRMRLKGRDRERARRKRQERLRAGKAEASGTVNQSTAAEASSGESSDEEEEQLQGGDTAEDNAVDLTGNAAIVKQEDGADNAVPGPSTQDTTTTSPVQKRRGRPKKQTAANDIP